VSPPARKLKPPHNVRVLQKWISEHVKEHEEGLVGRRYQRWLSYMVVSAILDRLRDENDEPVFLLKGGAAMELRLGLKARASGDYDVAFRERTGDMFERLDEALAYEFRGFTISRAEATDIRDIGAKRVDLKLSFKGRSWQTVQLELAHSEGEAGQEIDRVLAIPLDPVGIEGPREVACVSLRYQIAQKIHACTTEPEPGRINDRSRDLIDLLLLRGLVPHRGPVRAACVEIFNLRGMHAWPPRVTVYDEWRTSYPEEAAELGFKPSDVDDAAARVQAFIEQIDFAVPNQHD
jgi:Nucleotidyl transferase AbiEii toxin, Type IV TA system